MPDPASRVPLRGKSGTDDECPMCDGEGQICVGFGIYSNLRPGIAHCPECHGTGTVPDAGVYSFPRPCPCGESHIDRAIYWAHRLAHEEAA